MIGYLSGKIMNMRGDCAIILCGGVGYEVTLSGSAAAGLLGKDEGAVYTYLQVRDEEMVLYGFSSPEEKSMFLQLITVTGVGPRMGIAILSQMDMNDLAVAIGTSDVKRLTGIKGLGKKTAERIVLELREKVGSAEPGDAGGARAPAETGEDDDAVVALMTLGFTRAESSAAVARAKASGAEGVEEIIMQALRSM